MRLSPPPPSSSVKNYEMFLVFWSWFCPLRHTSCFIYVSYRARFGGFESQKPLFCSETGLSPDGVGATGREPLLERTLPTTHVSSFKTQSSCAVAALRSQPQTEQGRTCTEARGQKQVLNRKTAFTPTHPFPLWGLFCVGPCGDCPGNVGLGARRGR